MNELKATCDAKTRFWKGQKNTFGLLPGLEGTCPGCTTSAGGCWYRAPGKKQATCYVDNLMTARPNVRRVLEENTKLMMVSNYLEMVQILTVEVRRFEATELRRAKKNGEEPNLFYRIHWSGDMFNEDYTNALRAVIEAHPQITFWGYTRTFSAVTVLSDLPNLVLFLSLDPVNAQHGLALYDSLADDPNIRLCYMNSENNFQEHIDNAKAILDGRNKLREMLGAAPNDISWLDNIKMQACPVDTGELALDGGCSKCRMCMNDANKSVWFKT